MNSLIQDYPAILRGEHEAPCLSLYQPTHRQHPENLQDPIRFRNLVKRLEDSPRHKFASRDIPAVLRSAVALDGDRDSEHYFRAGTASRVEAPFASLGAASELVRRQGGEVIIVPGERMPTRSGAAAICRYRWTA